MLYLMSVLSIQDFLALLHVETYCSLLKKKKDGALPWCTEVVDGFRGFPI